MIPDGATLYLDMQHQITVKRCERGLLYRHLVMAINVLDSPQACKMPLLCSSSDRGEHI